MEFRILGPLEVSRDGNPMALGGARQRAVLALLLIHANRVLTVDRMGALLWGDEAPETVGHVIEVYVSQLRKALEPDGAPYRRLQRTAAGYSLQIEAGELDAFEFQRLVEQARGLAPNRAAELLEQALSLWRGPALTDFAGEHFAVSEAGRLNELRLLAVEDRIEAELALGRHAKLVGELVSLTNEHPLRERLSGQLMLALYRSGRQAEASEVYQRTRQRLVDELGMEPGPNLQLLLKRILQQDPTLGVGGDGEFLPTGTVTFLMTDVEGSTRLWDASSVIARRALDAHNSIISNAVAAHRGQLVESGREGDSFLAVFRQATDAVACALDLQRAMHARAWPPSAVIKVRCTVHTGEAELDGGHYVGGALYRCARLMAIGHGGQALLSQAVQELVADSLPDGTGLRDLGLHQLRDITRPEHVYQLLHADLPAEYPPLSSVARERTNLPASLTTFVGRAAESREVEGAVKQFRLVTLTGVGGAGKTRLAVESARAVATGFPGGAWFVEFAPATDSDLVPQTIAAALGVREQARRTILAALVDRLHEEPTLLILDNCEHLIEAIAETAAVLLTSCAELHVLATSRERLRVDGEHVSLVPPLAIPAKDQSAAVVAECESVQLFANRARLLVPSFTVDERNALAVAELCRRLDGIPLAIELAAGQISVLTPAEMIAQLGEQFGTAASGGRTGSPRQRTLWSTIEWSHHLMREDERSLFRRLSVFAGGFGLEAARPVGVATPVDAVDLVGLLARLVDKSVVVAEHDRWGRTRYRMLETIRDFARQRLNSSGDEAAVCRRHAEYYAAFGKDSDIRARGLDVDVWLDRLEQEHDNARAALSWALDHDPPLALRLALAWSALWEHRAHFKEGREWLAAALALPGNQSPAMVLDRIGALGASANLTAALGERPEAREQLDSALEMAEEAGEPLTLAMILCDLGSACRAEGDYASASTHYQRALSIVQGLRGSSPTGNPVAAGEASSRALVEVVEGALWLNLGVLARVAGDPTSAATSLGRALALNGGRLDRRGVLSHVAVGEMDLDGGDIQSAGEHFARALETAYVMFDPQVICEALWCVAGLAAATARPVQAVRLASACANLRAAIGSGPRTSSEGSSMFPSVRQLLDSARAALSQEEIAVAQDVGRAMSIDRAAGYALHDVLEVRPQSGMARDMPYLRASAKNADGSLAFMQGDLVTARRCYEDALSIAEAIGDDGMTASYLNSLGAVVASSGDFAAAQRHFEHALSIVDRPDASSLHFPHFGTAAALEAALHSNLGQARACVGDYVSARDHYERALGHFKHTRGGSWIDMNLNMAELALLSDDLKDARSQIEVALVAARDLKDPHRLAAGLEMAAGLAATASEPGRAMRLCGAAARIRSEHEAPRNFMSSFDRTTLPRITAAREVLGVQAQVEEQAGQAMDETEAIRCALTEPMAAG